jgi:hypothetical protein
MIGLFVDLDYNGQLDRDRVLKVAEAAHPMFVGMPGVQFKFFTLDEAAGRATNFYVWDSRGQAESFFSPEIRAQITELYGVEPTLRYVEIAQVVNNVAGATAATINS